MVIHSDPFLFAYATKDSWSLLTRIFCNICSSFLAPMKFRPLSLNIFDGVPRLEENLFKARIHASLVRLETSSRCTALVAKHTKRAMYRF